MGEWYEIYVKKELYGSAGTKSSAEYEKENILDKFKVKKSDIKIKKKIDPHITFAGHIPYHWGGGFFEPELDEKFAAKHPNLVRKGVRFRHYKKFGHDGVIELW